MAELTAPRHGAGDIRANAPTTAAYAAPNGWEGPMPNPIPIHAYVPDGITNHRGEPEAARRAARLGDLLRHVPAEALIDELGPPAA